jgi:glycosyltransferase involved in cell wall biosynthesis
MKLSIIVPVYNVEKYVERCIRSIMSQKLSSNDEFEVVIVNDGSLDNSMAIVNNLVNSYENVKVIDQDNKGLSIARNVGMQNCTGDYVWFVDSDDWILPNSVNTIIGIFKKFETVDAISFLLNSIYEETNEIVTGHHNNYLEKVETIAGSEYIFLKGGFAPVQRFAFRKQFLTDNNFTFLPGIFHEDGEFCMRVLYRCEQLYVLKQPLYNYLKRKNGSIMSSVSIKNIYDLMIVYKSLEKYGEDVVKEKDKKHWDAAIGQWIIFMFIYSRKFNHTQEFLNFYYKNRIVINKNVLHVLNAKLFSWKSSLVSLTIRFFPFVYMKYISYR